MNTKIEKIEKKITELQDRIRLLVALKKAELVKEKIRRKHGEAVNY